jgi:hypothetical protein
MAVAIKILGTQDLKRLVEGSVLQQYTAEDGHLALQILGRKTMGGNFCHKKPGLRLKAHRPPVKDEG